MPHTLATCVPYFPSASQIGGSLLLLLIVKPWIYMIFVLCFRYRASTPKPLSFPRMAAIVAVATIAGFGLVAAEAFLRWSFYTGHFADRGFGNWAILITIRLVTWSPLGAWIAELRGRRLVGWIASAIGMDLAFDVAISAAYDGSWVESGYAALCFLAFLVPLFIIGRRPSLKARFLGASVCRKCCYDLSGIVSGVCPECGTTAARTS